MNRNLFLENKYTNWYFSIMKCQGYMKIYVFKLEGI